MFDETGHADERLPPQHRCALRLAVGEEITCACTQQNAVGVMQRQERTNRQFCGFELGIERSITVQLALRCQLRDLATDATFGTHAAAVERLQCTAVATAGHPSCGPEKRNVGLSCNAVAARCVAAPSSNA
ncbi:hypothetical protein G6F65_020628 [Rhizopus arrhizus]|nr:hypothetical protein G6F65_020628 [Rhizopus arrhizus]